MVSPTVVSFTEKLDLNQRSECVGSAVGVMARIYAMLTRWLPISIAPPGQDLEVCVMDRGQAHALIFPCHKDGESWIDASTKKRIDIEPTHWRFWADDR